MQTAVQPEIPVEDLELRVEKTSTRKRVLNDKKIEQNPRKIEYYCDMCELLTIEKQLKRTAKDVQLCKGCHQQFNLIPEGKIHDAAERFLLGNVY